MRYFFCICMLAMSSAAQQFEIADVHPNEKGSTRMLMGRPALTRGDRFEMKNARMIDLIRMAYGYSGDKILEGPNWLEMDRFDVIAKLPAGATPETQKIMMQALLTDRFQLKFRREERPFPSYTLVAGKKPLLKPADGAGDSGCKPKTASGPPSEGGMIIGINGVQIALGPGGLIEFNCRNISMGDFAAGLRGMLGAGDLGENPVKDETGLTGIWNFDIRWTIGFIGLGGPASDRITVFQAMEKLGLKLEEHMYPTPVLVVESVDRKPTPNAPDIAAKLPPLRTATEFEIADVKPAAPGVRNGGLRNQPGGRVSAQPIIMRRLLARAFNTSSDSELLGIPEWAGSVGYNITAKAPSEYGPGPLDPDTLSAMLRSLLADRFKMKWHTEERPMTTYALVAVKPKMKRADPKVRSSCSYVDGTAGSETLKCQDVTMEEFADQLTRIASELQWPVADLTELEGGWDFTLTFNPFPQAAMAGRGRGDDPGAGAASEPAGSYSIFEAVEKQLGLKLAPRKQNMPVTVIDHLEQQPTEN
jgi:uncharacterized protein (TIGR03435 family)